MIRNMLLSLLLCMAAGSSAQTADRLFILGGELSNSAATCIADIDDVMPRMKALGLNTVLVPAYWEFIEPVEGKFDFTLVDRTIDRARENQLKVVFLWFGAWKNSMSCYAPAWFKTDTRRFPRSMTAEGKPLEIASVFAETVFEADSRAFTQLMRHLAEKDRTHGTVIMMQIENEIGMLESARDHSPLAEKAFRSEIPAPLRRVLGISKAATWADVQADDPYWDEKFMAWHYACYVERLAKIARREYNMPLYVNAAMNSRGRKPGEYPSAGPLAHLADIWKCGAPSIDLLAPDIYDTGFKSWAAQYDFAGNRLFIPETRCCANSGVRALYAFGEHRALGFSPFAIDQAQAADTAPITQAYALLSQLRPLLGQDNARWGLLFDGDDRERIITDKDVVMTCRHNFTLPWDPRATDGSTWPEGGALLMRLPNSSRQVAAEYLLAGSGVVVDFKTPSEKEQEQQKRLGEDGFVEAGGTASTPAAAPRFKGKRMGILSVDEVSVNDDGSLRFIRRENGDQDHQGRHARIGVGEFKILHVKLYSY